MYSGVFLGTLRSEATEKMNFVDAKNELSCQIAFGKVKKK